MVLIWLGSADVVGIPDRYFRAWSQHTLSKIHIAVCPDAFVLASGETRYIPMTIVGSMHCAHLQEKLKLLLQSILPARYQALRKVFRRVKLGS